MISIEMEDVYAVLQLCKPYLIGIAAAVVISAAVMIFCRRMSKQKGICQMAGRNCYADSSSCLGKSYLFRANVNAYWSCNGRWTGE